MAGVCNATRMRLALAWALLIKVPGVNQAARRLPRTNGLLWRRNGTARRLMIQGSKGTNSWMASCMCPRMHSHPGA